MGIPKETFFSYSYIAEKEDLILYHALRNIKKGFYIDIGACSSIDGSVTKALYDMGWHGINVEPQKGYYLDLQKNRPRDINLNIGVSDSGNELMLYGQGALATFSEQIVKYHHEAQDTDSELSLIGKVATQPLSEICAHYLPHEQGKPIPVHFCKIDVEGFEREVLLSHDYQNYRPWIFVVEATLPNSDIPSYDKWEYILLDNGYEFALSYNSNRYYVDRCRTDIIECLHAITGEEYLSRQYNIFHVDSRKVDSSTERILLSQLFIDEGKGFTEAHKMITESIISDEKIYTIRFDLSDYHAIRAMRFDPLEGHYCEVEILSAKDAHGAVYPEPQASIRVGKADRFLSTDPQYLIASPCENFLEIRFRLRVLSLFEAEQAVYSYIWHQSEQFAQQEDKIVRQTELNEQLNTRVGAQDALLSQQRERMEWQDGQIVRQTELIEQLNTQVGAQDTLLSQQRERMEWQNGQIEDLHTQLEELQNSVYWKMMAPFRAVHNYFKRARKGSR